MNLVAFIDFVAGHASFDAVSYVVLIAILVQLRRIEDRVVRQADDVAKQSVITNMLATKIRQLEKSVSHG